MQGNEVFNFVDVVEVVLPQIKLLKLGERGEVLQSADLVDGKGEDLEVRHLSEDLNIVYVIAPAIEILDLADVVGLGFVPDEFLSKRFAHSNFELNLRSTDN